MRAKELASEYPVVELGADAVDAARLLAERQLPGLIVVDEKDHPVAILPGSQILRFVVPRYVQDDPALARVYDERNADKLCGRLSGKRVEELLPRDLPPLPVVRGDATAMEIAALMAGSRSPLVAVVEPDAGGRDRVVGAITVATLLTKLLPPS